MKIDFQMNMWFVESRNFGMCWARWTKYIKEIESRRRKRRKNGENLFFLSVPKVMRRTLFMETR